MFAKSRDFSGTRKFYFNMEDFTTVINQLSDLVGKLNFGKTYTFLLFDYFSITNILFYTENIKQVYYVHAYFNEKVGF